ncbi:MAG: SIMPL domain-containing protein [Cecembia sp.]
MKKILSVTIFVLLFLGAQAQQLPVIEVEGLSEVSVLPDEALIYISLTEKAMTVADATNGLNKKTKSIEEALKKSGVKTYQFFAENYFVQVNRVFSRGTSRDSGFVASQNIRVRVSDIEKDLIKVTETIHQTGNPGFSLSLNVSDNLKKQTEEHLLELAIEDAIKKAHIIAKSIGVEDIKVHKVVYTSTSNTFYPIMREARVSMASDMAPMEEPVIRPEARKLTDKVVVTFTF